MADLDVTNLLISRGIIIETIPFLRQIRTEFLFAGQITKEEFSQILEEIEKPLRKIADEMAIVINQESMSPVIIYRRRIKSVSAKLQDVIENSEDFQRLIQTLRELVSYFHQIIAVEDVYPETLKILDSIEFICNKY
jgi:hypothetical protein